jgi:hypothetical protein
MEDREPILGEVSSSTHVPHVVILFLPKDARFSEEYRKGNETEATAKVTEVTAEEEKQFAENLLRQCEPAIFKAYLSWRVRDSRIKKESTIGAYWKRICMFYRDIEGVAMGNEILKDVRAVCSYHCPLSYKFKLTVAQVDSNPGAR